MLKILVVDDEAIEVEALRRIIGERYGEAFQVFTALNGQKAISLAEAQRVDIVLMDIEMPGISGLDAAKIIKQRLPRCRVIILTAYQRFQYAQAAIAIGAEDYLLKPVGNAELIGQIDKAIKSIQRDRESDERRSYLDQLAKEQFVLSVISGYSSAQSLASQLGELGLTFSHGFFVIFKDASHHRSAEQVHAHIRPQLKKWSGVTLLPYEYDERLMMVVMMGSVYQSQEAVRNVLRGMLDAASRGGRVLLYAGLGNIVTDVNDLQASYNQASESLARCTDQEPIRFPQDAQADGANRQGGMERRLYQYLLDKDFEGAIRLSDTMLETLFYLGRHRGAVVKTMGQMLKNVAGMLTRDARADYEPEQALAGLLEERMTQQEISIAIRNLLARWIRELDDQPAARIRKIRKEIEGYIGANYQEDLSIKQIAKDMHYSEPYFSKLFARCFQRNFVTYLTDYRMQVARDMLQSPLASIKEISAAVGFSDSNYFSKVFRKAYGVSPSDYRRMLYTQAKETEVPSV